MADWSFLTDFHFIRPLWILGLVPAALCLLWIKKLTRKAGNWAQVINPALLPYLMQNNANNSSRSHYSSWALGISWLLFCIALAGPTWSQLPQPVHKEDSALVLVLDLSPSMLAEDIPPNRLVRARYKLIDILNARKQGFTGMVVYGGEAFAVSPLTEDGNTIISLVPTLDPMLLPSYGSNTEDGIGAAIELINNGGYQRADILLITDNVDQSAFKNISSQLKNGEVRLHILGVGTAEGAPIPLGNQGFVKDSSGNIILPKLEAYDLQQLANLGNGSYVTITNDGSDVERLLNAIKQAFPSTTEVTDRSFDIWQDRGFWLIILLLPLLILRFRRGAVFVVILAPALLNTPAVEASAWQDLWFTADQQGSKALKSGDTETAQQLFNNPKWQASAAYLNKDYAEAATLFGEQKNADDYYNNGNALARLGKLDDAINAYNKALSLEPTMEDAIANRGLIEQLKQQQQDQSQDKKDQDQQQEQGQQQDQQNQPSDQNPSEQSDPQSKKQPEEEQHQEKQQQKADSQEEAGKADEKQEQQTQQQKIEEQLLNEQQQQELEQWLRRVPDDPGGLLRQKFYYQSQQRASDSRRPAPPNQQERW